jgi:DNA-binding LacI/PurR family transcriptional regulator
MTTAAQSSPRRATSYDVARAAGVSQSTVSRCFQDDSNISPATRNRVMETAQRLGYIPNALARSLITQQSNMVGVVVTRYTQRGNPDVIYAIGASLAAAGKQLLLIVVDSDWPPPGALRGALEYPLDGLISCVLIADDDMKELLGRRIPLVFYNRDPERFTVDSVTANHFLAAADVASALHAAGHRRFVCVGGPAVAPVSRQRTQGFITRLNTLGIGATPLLETDYSYEAGRAVFRDRAARQPRPDAVFCANDQIALGVMDACRFDLGWSVPDDVSIVGFDDVAEAGRPSYELTTMHQDSDEMARQAVRLLLLRLAEPDGAPVNALVPAVFVRRRSARLQGPA